MEFKINKTDDSFHFEDNLKLIEKRLFITALTILKNYDLAKDALQETIYIAFKKIDKLKNKDLFGYWITKIIINESYKLYNIRKKTTSICDFQNFFSDEIYKSELEFFELISGLPKADKTIIILRFYYGYSIKEISSITKFSLSKTKSRLYRALNKIKMEENL